MPSPPEGVTVYGWDRLAEAAGLATGATMRRRRQQPRPGAQPAGCYWTGHAYHYLWRVPDLVDKAPLSPGRQAAWDANRTCARCGAKSGDPWSKARDGRRYCPGCLRPAMEDLWAAERAADRVELGGWARELLADERVVLVAGRAVPRAVEMRAETLDGVVLVDALVRYPERGPGRVFGELPAEVAARAIDTAAAGELLAGLVGRRLVCWRPWDSLLEATLNLRQVEPGGPGLDPDTLGHLRTAADDVLGPRFDRWVGEPEGSVFVTGRPRRQQGPVEPAALVAHMRAVLAQMAETPAVADAAA